MKARGFPASEGAELASALLADSKGPQDVDKLMDRFGKTYATLEKSRTPVPQLLPQMTRVMSHGITAEQAAQMLAVVAPASPHEEGVAVEAAFRAIDQIKIKGTGAEFGVKDGMSPLESIKAFATNINERREKLIAAGKTDQQAEDAIRKQLAEKDIAVEVREARGLVQGFGYQGIQLGGLERFRQYGEQTPADFTADSVRKNTLTNASQKAQHNADDAIARTDTGAKYQDSEAALEQARIGVTKSGELENRQAANIPNRALNWFAMTDRQQQLTNVKALQSLLEYGCTEMHGQGRLASAIPAEFQEPAGGIMAGVWTAVRTALGGEATKDLGEGWKSQQRVNQEILRLLQAIEKNTGKNPNQVMADMQKARALVSPPAPGAGARQ